MGLPKGRQEKTPLKRQRQTRRQRLEKKPHKGNKTAVLVFFVAVVLIVGIASLALFSQNDSSEATTLNDSQVEETNTGEATVGGAAKTSESAMVQAAFEAFGQYYFFEEERAQRYLDYQEAYPDLTPEQIVFRVNVDLDTTDYDYATAVADPGSILALVNKHYYLPYEYTPADLAYYGEVPVRYEALGPLEQLVADAYQDGVSLTPTSGFRSAEQQETLHNGYIQEIGSDWTETQSARPGFSDHQTGLAIDFYPTDYQFYDTPQAYWLEENVYKYGFIIRYPEDCTDVTLYIHEPWHIRYVGKEVAEFMHTNNISTLEEYWVKYIQHAPSSQG